jgi:SNF2 family DNA or RNA helicase
LATINLEFDSEANTLILRGADATVLRHPLFAAYLREVGGSVEADSTIRMPTTAESLTTRYQTIAKIFVRIGARLETGGHASDVLDRVESEERRFAIFSKDASDIWHRQIDTEAFRSFVSIVERDCPGRTFYRKQLLSAFHLAFAQNACNFSVPGAGKTSIVYAAYAFLKSLPTDNEKAINRLLIVGPLSSFKVWEDEYKDIFLRAPAARRISGAMTASERSDHLRGIRFASRDVEITLTSYPTLAASEDDFRAYLTRPGFRTMMVLDEAHYIKRDDGIWASAALRLAPLAASRVILTGTPAPNGYEDLSNLFRFIYPSRQIIGFPAASLRAMTDGAMPRAVPELKAKIQPFYTRIRKVDLGLPEVNEARVPVPMNERHERIYRALERRIVPHLRQDLDSPGAPLRVKARLIRLRQASVNPELLLRPLEEEGVFDTDGTGDFSISELEVIDLVRGFEATRDLVRLEICQDLALNILRQQDKVLIWSYFLGNLELLRHNFQGTADFVEVLTGATPISGGDIEVEPLLGTREEIIDRFHSTRGSAILIANPQAVGESISLHKVCRSAIYFDRDFNAGRYIQSKDRIHRYNPTGGGSVTYHYLISQTTIDDDIDGRLVIKERRLSDLVDAAEIPLFTANVDDDVDDIRAILEAYERRKTR